MTARLFSVPAFHFDILPRIGGWSKLASRGVKSKDGATMEFNNDSLGQMVRNFQARGDALAICADHLSAYVSQTGRPAPAFGFFTALALFEAGKLVAFHSLDGAPSPDGTDDNGRPRDGLFAKLGEITPLGADPLQGFAGFKFLSPMFQESAQSEDGSQIGYALLDAAVTNTPFQSGTALQFHALTAPTTGAHAMAKFNPGDRVKIDPAGLTIRGGSIGVVKSEDQDGIVVQFPDGKELHYRAYDLIKMSSPSPGDKAVKMASATGLSKGDRVRTESGTVATVIVPENVDGIWDQVLCEKADGSRFKANAIELTKMSAMSDTTHGKGAVKMAMDVKCPKCGSPAARDGVDDMGDAQYRCERGHTFGDHQLSKMSATTPGARRRFSGATPMDEATMAVKCGFAPDDDAEKKLAKVMAFMAAPEGEPDGDDDEDNAVKAMADDLGVEDGPKKMTRMFAALRATRAPVSEVAALKNTITTLSQRLDARDSADADAKLATFADDAIRNGQWDAGKREQLITFARADMKAASSSLLPKGSVHVLGRIADPSRLDNRNHLASAQADGETVNGQKRTGVEFSQKVKAHMLSANLTGTEGLKKATAAMAASHPELARAALGR